MTRLQALSPRRLVAVWRAASTFIGASTARVTAISVLSLLRGLAEAAVLVVVARVALALSDGDERLGLDLGPFGVKTMTISQALGAAVVAAVCMLVLHLLVSELIGPHVQRGARHCSSAAVRRVSPELLEPPVCRTGGSSAGRPHDLCRPGDEGGSLTAAIVTAELQSARADRNRRHRRCPRRAGDGGWRGRPGHAAATVERTDPPTSRGQPRQQQRFRHVHD